MKNTPRDFFLHFGAFGTLYLAAIALITLLFRMIDYALPDVVRGPYYADPYSGPMRFAIASLIILVPIFLYLMRVIQQEARKTPERRSMGIRRWLTYITLFIAGATIVGDLIALLNSFLGGTLANTFALKVAVLFVVMGAAFWYFMLDIRGYWQHREKMSQMVGYGVLAAVLASIVGGFLIMGSPSVQRDVRLDQEQVNDLSSLQYQIVGYWQQNERLPQSLDAIESDITGYTVPEAPEGRPAYEYRTEGALTFVLCATFAQDADETRYSIAPEAYGLRGSTHWEYTKGRSCFERTIDPNLIRPNPRLTD